MTVNELITVLKTLQNNGHGDYVVFALSDHIPFKQRHSD